MEGFGKVVNGNGMLFANPIPEEFSLPKEMIDRAIDQAVKEAAEQGIYGHANTPFILAKIKELTEGNSLPANRGLIESNVAMAANVAIEYSKLLQSTPYLSNNHHKALYQEPLSPVTIKTPASVIKIEDESASRGLRKVMGEPDSTVPVPKEQSGKATSGDAVSIVEESTMPNEKSTEAAKEHHVRTSTTESRSSASVNSQLVSASIHACLSN